MTVALSLGGTPLALPDRDGVSIDRAPIGAAQRMGNATLTIDLIATKASIGVRWSLLTKAERDAIVSAWTANAAASQPLILPDAGTYTVLPGLNGLAEVQVFDAANMPWYNLTAKFEEV